MKHYLIILLVCVAISCSNKEKRIVSSNINSLKEYINFDLAPLSIIWLKTKMAKVNDRFLASPDKNPVASNLKIIVTLTSSDWQKMRNEYYNSVSDEIYLPKDFFEEEWIPSSFKSTLNINNDLIEIRRYKATRFSGEKFKEGFLFFTTKNQLYIYMEN